MALPQELRAVIAGEVRTDDETRAAYNHDASIFTVEPAAVISPANVDDLKKLVRFVSERKATYPSLSLTARSAGTDMTGGPLTTSVVVDFLAHFSGVRNLDVTKRTVSVLPGTFYRDFEPVTLKEGLLLPCFPASRELCTVGGMVANNSGGEKTLKYGKTAQFVERLSVVFSDGNEYEVRPLSKLELDKKMAQADFEGDIYRRVYNMVANNRELLLKAKPDVSKNSSGYALWNVWDGTTFDLTQLIVGSQGTLGLVTDITFRLVPKSAHSKLLVIFLPDASMLAEITVALLPFRPESLEVNDDNAFKLALRYVRDLLKIMHPKHFFALMFSFFPEFLMMLTGGLPKLVLLVEFAGDDEEEIDQQLAEAYKVCEQFPVKRHITKTEDEAGKYWTIRRESFNLLRKHVHGKRTVPFIDDVIVKPEFLPEFLPRLQAILDSYKLLYTITGHDGNGNLHIIPLADMTIAQNREVIPEIAEKVFALVREFHGSLSAEHNDGIVRTPFLSYMFGPEVLELFEETKRIFDPQNIFNPGKKVGGTLQYLKDHISHI